MTLDCSLVYAVAPVGLMFFLYLLHIAGLGAFRVATALLKSCVGAAAYQRVGWGFSGFPSVRDVDYVFFQVVKHQQLRCFRYAFWLRQI